MRHAEDVENFRTQHVDEFHKSREKFDFMVKCYEASIPKRFWYVKGEGSKKNKAAFKKVICPYRKWIKRNRHEGRCLYFSGNVGAGKTYAACYIGTQAIRAGFDVYYTTVTTLVKDLRSAISSREDRQRLEWLLGSDFVILDEVGKESMKRDSVTFSAFEDMVKQRFDDCMPTLFCSNQSVDITSKLYGPTFGSLFASRQCTVVALGQGKDHRR